MKVVSTTADPSHERLQVTELESALEPMKLRLRTLPGFALDNLPLRAEVSG